jgi:hypothetical protein
MKRLALTAASLLVATAVSAQIYQWKDENGKTIISDKAPVGNVRQQKKVESEAPATGASPQKTAADKDLEFRKRQKEAQDGAEKAKKEQTASSDKKENCDNARRHLQVLESGERISLRDDKGERYFMEDKQREQEIAKTREMVQSNCK